MSIALNISTLEIRPGAVPAALARLHEWNARTLLKGRLAGCFHSEIGPLNRIVLVHSYDGTGGMAADRDLVFDAADPYGLKGVLNGFSMDAYASFPSAGEPETGNVGPYFEIRSYSLRPDGLAPTIAAWEQALGARRAVSPLFTVAYARSGSMPRFVHIWPFRSLDERMKLRKQAVESGVWPPPNGIDHITGMETAIYLAADFSPVF